MLTSLHALQEPGFAHIILYAVLSFWSCLMWQCQPTRFSSFLMSTQWKLPPLKSWIKWQENSNDSDSVGKVGLEEMGKHGGYTVRILYPQNAAALQERQLEHISALHCNQALLWDFDKTTSRLMNKWWLGSISLKDPKSSKQSLYKLSCYWNHACCSCTVVSQTNKPLFQSKDNFSLLTYPHVPESEPEKDFWFPGMWRLMESGQPARKV